MPPATQHAILPPDVEADVVRAENVLAYLNLSDLRRMMVLDIIVSRWKSKIADALPDAARRRAELTDDEIGEAFDAANEAVRDRLGRMYHSWNGAPPPHRDDLGGEPFLHRFHRHFAREIEKRIAGKGSATPKSTPATHGDMSESVTIPTMDDMQRLVGAFGNANFDCGAHDDSSDMTYGDVLEKSHAARANLVAAIQQLHDAAIGIVRESTLLPSPFKHKSTCDLAPYLLGIADVRCTCGALDHTAESRTLRAPEVTDAAPNDALDRAILREAANWLENQEGVEPDWDGVTVASRAEMAAAIQRAAARLPNPTETPAEREMREKLAEEMKPLPFDEYVRADNGFARRMQLLNITPAERAIYDAMVEVEKVGPHVWLTDAVILLGKARDRVADYVDDQTNKGSSTPKSTPTGLPHSSTEKA